MITYAAIAWMVSTDPVGRVEKSGEVWSPGPFEQTVWVLDASAPMGARVVNVKTRRELAYQPTGAAAPRRVVAKPVESSAIPDLLSVGDEVTCVV
ncbi:hypothetical protein [Nocardia sp. NPDC004722]